MSSPADLLPLVDSVSPADQQALIQAVAAAHDSRTPIYPIGGGTSLDFGLPTRQGGTGLATTGLDRIVDYPAGDMTITVEAGVSMAALAEALAGQGQRLPVDAALAARATLGGMVATNTSGPRRYGHGTLRDYLIGIRAVDGRGKVFQGGGRVVKNVAGYDFCKLLTGSLGTLGVILQLTLRVVPLAPRSLLVGCRVADLDQAERLLADLVHSRTTPCAIELLVGPAWAALVNEQPGSSGLGALVVGLEGTAAEIDWMAGQLESEWKGQGIPAVRSWAGDDADRLWDQLIGFPAGGPAPLVIQARVRPRSVVGWVERVRQLDPTCSIAAHAGSGVLTVRFAEFPADCVSRWLVGQLQPAAVRDGGSVIVLSTALGERTRQATWGPRDASVRLMESIRDQFDPRHILNPGRFVY